VQSPDGVISFRPAESESKLSEEQRRAELQQKLEKDYKLVFSKGEVHRLWDSASQSYLNRPTRLPSLPELQVLKKQLRV
jgi:hypothetical protein